MFSISVNSGIPIYRQVADAVIRQIDRGQLKHGELLPSVRQLANELGINPMTVSKAWSYLEAEGIVKRRRGVGMVVIRKAEKPEQSLRPAITQLIADAKQLGLTSAQLTKLIRHHWK